MSYTIVTYGFGGDDSFLIPTYGFGVGGRSLVILNFLLEITQSDNILINLNEIFNFTLFVDVTKDFALKINT